MIIEMPGAMQRPAFFCPKKCGLSVGNSLFFRVADQQSIDFPKRNGSLLIFGGVLTKSCLYILAGYINTDFHRFATD